MKTNTTTKKQDFNSIVNQEIKGKFISQHVFCNVNSLVEFSISKSIEGDQNAPIQFEDVENLYTYPELIGKHVNFDGGTEDERETEIQRLMELSTLDSTTPLQVEEIEADIEELKNLDTQAQDVFEWWAISDYFMRQLRERGYVVYTDSYYNYWGRTTTGQAILLDGIVSRICSDMEILEGQKNSWESIKAR